MAYYAQSRSPELKHPVPTHPAYIPEPPSTPSSPHGYKRFASSPPPSNPSQAAARSPPQQQQQQAGAAPSFGAAYAPAPPAPMQHPAFQTAQMHRAGASGAMGGGGGAGPVPQPDYAAWGMNDATAQLGMQLGQSAVAAGQNYVKQNFGGIVPGVGALKHHFNVSNSYVFQKLRIVVFPWRHRPWTRKILRSEQGAAEWVPPREDLNSPDLYIPSMALVTYVLLVALQSGLQGSFHPDELGVASSKALAVVLFDYAVVKLGCYFLNIQGSSQSFDLVAYGGYKFVGVILTVLTGLVGFGRVVWWIVFVYAFCANGFFLLRSLRQVVLPDVNNTASSAGTVSQAQRSRRIMFIFLVAVSQALYMGILVRV